MTREANPIVAGRPTERDWHGLVRGYLRDDGTMSASLHELARSPLQLDRRGVLAAWSELDAPCSTVVAGVLQLPCARLDRAPDDDWPRVFEAAVAEVASAAREPVLALGGGVDAAAVLVAWRASGRAMPVVCTLATGLVDYDEVEVALAIAAQLGTRCEVVEVPPPELVALAPRAAIAAEAPLYNLHPVHRLALALAARRRGAKVLVTGDAADAVFAGRPDLDYVPIIAALTRSAELELASPFFAEAVIRATATDPTKRAARDYVRAHGLGWLADRRKQPRLLPALELSPILDRERIVKLARRLELSARLDTDRQRVGWATLDHLARTLEAR